MMSNALFWRVEWTNTTPRPVRVSLKVVRVSISSNEKEDNAANEVCCLTKVLVLPHEWPWCMRDDAGCMAARTRARQRSDKSKQSDAQERAAWHHIICTHA